MPQAIKAYLLISSSLIVALILTFLHIPTETYWMQPLWIIIVLLYWALMKPQYINVGAAWIIGSFLDILYNAPFGENSLTLVLITFLLTKFGDKIISLGFLKISMVIFGLIIIYQSLQFLIQFSTGNYFDVRNILGTALASSLIWPPLAFILFNLQTKLRI